MNKKELIETCENIMKDLQKRVKNSRMYGEDWDVSHDTICNDKYEISISIHDCDNFSMYLGKKPYFVFKLMEEKLESRDFEKMSVGIFCRNVVYKNVVTDEVVVICLFVNKQGESSLFYPKNQ